VDRTDRNEAQKRPTKAQLQAAERAAAKARSKVVEDVERLCVDAGISLAALAREAGVPYPHLWRMMAGKVRPTLETYAKLAIPLGADLSTRLYPNTGPTIRDRHQARILEATLEMLHPRWRPVTEVAVWKPARGWIDVVLHEPREHVLVATEIEGELRRLEQMVRWSREKVESLPSSSIWRQVEEGVDRPPAVSQLLFVRRTRTTRQVAHEFARQLALAYPAHPEDALASLTGTAPWPGAAMIWADIKPERVRFLPTR
jgi:transcriptional regulator with XRE-family HTH domain